MISAWRSRNRRSSSFLRRIQLVTSALHLLVLHDRQEGTTLARTYRPPREMGSTQSFCSGVPALPQYAQPPHAALKADHCDSVRSCTFEAMRRLRRREYLTARVGLRDGTDELSRVVKRPGVVKVGVSRAQTFATRPGIREGPQPDEAESRR